MLRLRGLIISHSVGALALALWIKFNSNKLATALKIDTIRVKQQYVVQFYFERKARREKMTCL